MNRKQLIVWLVLAALVGGLSLWVWSRDHADWQPLRAERGRVLEAFDPNAVERVTIRSGSKHLSLNRKGERWEVSERAYPADFQKVRRLVQTLWELTPAQTLEVGASQFGRLQLAPMDATDESTRGTEVTLSGANGKALAVLRIGKEHVRKNDAFPDGQGFPEGRYVMDGANPGTVALVTETFSEVKPEPESWLDAAFPKIGNVQSVEVDGGKDELRWKLVQREGKWEMEGLKAEEKLDPVNVPSPFATLANLRFADVLSPDDPVPSMPRRLTVTTDDGFTYRFETGDAAAEGRFPVRFTVEAILSEARRPEKDETAEQTKERDDAFAKKKRDLEARLQREKAQEGRIFLFSTQPFSAWLVPRGNLLKAEPKAKEAATPAPKKEEPSPAGKAEPAAPEYPEDAIPEKAERF